MNPVRKGTPPARHLLGSGAMRRLRKSGLVVGSCACKRMGPAASRAWVRAYHFGECKVNPPDHLVMFPISA